jgi:hypothetical protein
MNTVDDLIFSLKNLGFDNIHPSIPFKDRKILKNIATMMSKETYITEGQANLVLKILRENLNYLDALKEDIERFLTTPLWNKKFRVNEKIRKIFIKYEKNEGSQIVVEYSFDKTVKKELILINSQVRVERYDINHKGYLYNLTEKNIATLYQHLSPLKFEFSNDFLELYEKISNLDLVAIKEKFQFENFYTSKLEPNKYTFDTKNPLVILDQKIKYQYNFLGDFDENIKTTLEYKIANRIQPKIFINSNLYSLNKTLEALGNLDRNRILLVFDDFSAINSINSLRKLISFLELTDNEKNVGIYFRFDNKQEGSSFNKLIFEYKLNKKLDQSTEIVGIGNGKVPKFMVKNSWYPDAVISFTNSLRNNKSDVYCNECDLIVYYTNIRPLISNVHEIL